MCPQGSAGSQCKVLARTFSGSDWAWLRPLPPCLPATLSVRLLTRRTHGLILYSGPLAPHPRHHLDLPTPLLALELREGRPVALLEGAGGSLQLTVNTTLHDGEWHTVHLQLTTQAGERGTLSPVYCHCSVVYLIQSS